MTLLIAACALVALSLGGLATMAFVWCCFPDEGRSADLTAYWYRFRAFVSRAPGRKVREFVVVER